MEVIKPNKIYTWFTKYNCIHTKKRVSCDTLFYMLYINTITPVTHLYVRQQNSSCDVQDNPVYNRQSHR